MSAANTYYLGNPNRLLGIYSQFASLSYLYSSYGMFGGAPYSSSYRVRVQGSGTTTSTFGLFVEDSTGANIFWTRDNGDVWCTNGVWFTSDESKKRDITLMDEPVLGKLMKVVPKRFKLKQQGDAAETLSGLTTGNIEPLFPEAVRHFETYDDGLNEDGEQVREPKHEASSALNAGAILPYIIKCNQEQQVYIDALSSRLEDIEIILNKKGEN